MRPVSLEPLRPEVKTFEKKISRKVTIGQITEVKYYAPYAFLWQKF
jgi:hypothetical protein